MAKSRSRYEETEAKPKNDAYTGLLALSLIALLASCVVLYLDYAQYGQTNGPAVNIPKPAPPSGAAPSGTSQIPAKLGDLVAEPLLAPMASGTVVPVSNVETTNDGPQLSPPN